MKMLEVTNVHFETLLTLIPSIYLAEKIVKKSII